MVSGGIDLGDGIGRALACGMAAGLLGGCASGPGAGGMAVEPRPAPAFAGVDSLGEPVDLAAYSGRVLVIDFWATWCGPCRASMPNMGLVEQRFGADPGVAFLAVHTDETGDPAAYFAQNDYTMRLVPRGRQIAAAFDVYTLPTYVVINAAGEIVFRHESQLTNEVRDRLIREIAAAKPR